MSGRGIRVTPRPVPHEVFKAQVRPNGMVGVWLPTGRMQHVRAVVKDIPGREYLDTHMCWEIPPTPTAVGALFAAAPDIPASARVRELAAAATAQHRRWDWHIGAAAHTDGYVGLLTDETDRLVTAGPADAARVAADLDGQPWGDWVSTTPWDHQRRGIMWASDGDVSLIAAKMGGGKTLTTVGALNRWQARNVLTVCPAAVIGVWPRELRRHSPRDWHVVDGFELTRNGTVNKAKSTTDLRWQRIVEAWEFCPCGRPHMGVINYESLSYEAIAAWLPRHSRTGERLLDATVFDEAHRLKAAGGRASKIAAKWLPHTPRRIGLTGTPIPQGLEDIYGTFRALDPAIFGTSMTAYRKRHLIMGGYEETQVIGVVDPDDLARRFHSITWIPKVKLDVPRMLPHVVVAFDLEPKARRAYDELRKRSYVDLAEFAGRDAELDGKTAPVTLLREQQMTGGWVPDEAEGEQIRISTAKQDHLEQVLVDLEGEPTVVVCRFLTDIAAVREVAERLGRSYGEISGASKSGLTRDAEMAAVDICAVQIQSGGAGIDLVRSRVMVWYSADFALVNFDQMRAREQRPGQLRRVVNIFLVARDTIDSEIFDALNARRDALGWVVNARRPDLSVRVGMYVPDPLEDEGDADADGLTPDLHHLEQYLVGVDPASVPGQGSLAVARASRRLTASVQAQDVEMMRAAGIEDF